MGDVLYHLGQSGSLHCLAEDGSTKAVRLFVAPNPSHLEFINPVILGMVRAEQELLNDSDRKRVMGLLVHGDASFSGLGIVPETLQLSDLEGFKTGGTVHIVINNQVQELSSDRSFGFSFCRLALQQFLLLVVRVSMPQTS